MIPQIVFGAFYTNEFNLKNRIKKNNFGYAMSNRVLIIALHFAKAGQFIN